MAPVHPPGGHVHMELAFPGSHSLLACICPQPLCNAHRASPYGRVDFSTVGFSMSSHLFTTVPSERLIIVHVGVHSGSHPLTIYLSRYIHSQPALPNSCKVDGWALTITSVLGQVAFSSEYTLLLQHTSMYTDPSRS